MLSTPTLTYRFTVLLITFILCGDVYGQNVDFAFKAGASFSSFTSFESAPRASYSIGTVGGIHISKAFRLESGLNYMRKGALKIEATANNGTPFSTVRFPEYQLRYNYIQLPLLITVGNETISVHTGLYFSRLLKADLKSEIGEIDLKDEVGDWDNGFIMGFRVNFASKMFFELSRSWGFSNIKIPEDSKNKSFRLLIGYFLVKGRHTKKVENRRILN